ncbi:hypothetical protein MCOR34_001120 [Pyricularia oryzae]|nr:hypothetical protein MCOR34_001120 [Pyricularia oryzae]KAI6473662.1 hypothetical protein MCOR17_002535 [Pyricularia oryzae]KAI6478668.1 hypothetical protein MCOR13_011675 [Pyricularia oryzae]KAI6548084.1 hypothetical protein MCOR04_011641 [Pyricularia oryzae]
MAKYAIYREQANPSPNESSNSQPNYAFRPRRKETSRLVLVALSKFTLLSGPNPLVPQVDVPLDDAGPGDGPDGRGFPPARLRVVLVRSGTRRPWPLSRDLVNNNTMNME